jgi:hypothetical protein
MYCPCVDDEVRARPRESREELGGEQIAFQTIAARAGKDDVPGNVRAAARQWMYVVKRRKVELERRRAVHATAAAVAHRGAFDGSLLMSGGNWFGAAAGARLAWE